MRRLRPLRLLPALLLLACPPDRSGDDDSSSEPPPVDFPAMSASWSFGECWGACSGTLTVSVLGALVYDAPDYESYTGHHAEGQLDSGAMGDLGQAYGAIPRESLQAVYGCPDCADGGAEVLGWEDGITPATVTFDYGEPPAELVAIHEFLSAWMEGMETCDGADGATIQVCEEQPLAAPGGDEDPPRL